MAIQPLWRSSAQDWKATWLPTSKNCRIIVVCHTGTHSARVAIRGWHGHERIEPRHIYCSTEVNESFRKQHMVEDSRGTVKRIQNEEEQHHISMIACQECTVVSQWATDFVIGRSLNSGVGGYDSWWRVRLSLHTRSVVRRELVRDKAIQESVDCFQCVTSVNDTNHQLSCSQNMPTRSVPVIQRNSFSVWDTSESLHVPMVVSYKPILDPKC